VAKPDETDVHRIILSAEGRHYRAAVNLRVDGHQLASRSAHHDRLDIDELLDAVVRKLPSVTAFLDAAER
jgi:hypothetical protein